jgi:hypothetical protein
MIITDKFVYVHQPKTGGTFVTSALLDLHGIRWSLWMHAKNALLGDLSYRTPHGRFVYNANKHGVCDEIPPRYQDRLIVATVRNPLDRYVSEYEFGWWKKRRFLKYYRAVPGFEREYANFPELSFEQFMRLQTYAFCAPKFGGMNLEPPLGLQGLQFVEYFFRDAKRVIASWSDDYIGSERFERDRYPVRFIRTERLNEQLHEFLADMGYPVAEIEFVRSKKRVLPLGKGRTREQKWQRYYTPELREWVRQKDRVVFEQFPEFDS